MIKYEIGNAASILAARPDTVENKHPIEEIKESKEFSRILLECAPHPIIVQSANTSIRYINPAFEKLSGYSLKEIIGKKAPYLFWPKEKKDEYLKDMRNHIGQDQLVPKAREFQRKSGERFWVKVLASFIKENGELKQIITSYIDITESRKAEEKNIILAALVEASNEAIFGTTLDGVITSWNKGASKIFGYTESEIIGKSISLLVPPGRENRLVWIQEKIQRGENIDNLERDYLRKDGSIANILLTISPVYNAEKIIISMSSVASDITELKKVEESLRESERFNSSLLTNSPNPILVFGPDFSIRYVNKAFEAVTGFSGAEVRNRKPPFPWWKPEHHLEYSAAIHDAINRGFAKYERLIQKKNGEDAWIEFDLTPIVENGVVKNYLSMWVDKTQRKHAEEEQKQSTEKLVKAMEDMIQAMARIVEMRDPYTAGHQRRVAKLSVEIAQEIGLSKDRITGLRLAALIHDIGKVRVPAEILTHPDGLTEAEFAILRTHPAMGYDITKNIDLPWPIAQTIHQHHERMNGSGYPLGISGDNIILEARILAVADVVEAISSHRPYRPALGVDRALAEISEKKGQLFDSIVVEACLRIFNEHGFKFE